MNFRSEINGLRAIAVIAVVLFHFNVGWISGGFAGVDVFFVISGYLMTAIIFSKTKSHSFSLINFYVSRANRIIPPLAVMCTILLILGYFFLTTWDYKTLGRDTATSMFFVSSIMFSLRGGYFDTGENFLLHTWSLSTEWQFYIIYPLIASALYKQYSEEKTKIYITLIAITSFIFSIYFSKTNPTEAYYILPTRAWEMLLGGIAYLYPTRIKNKNGLYFFGIGLIIISYFSFSKNTVWPGFLAAIPAFGAFLIIQSNHKNIITENIIFQKIGLWSYSIYLWHWPVSVSFKYFNVPDEYKIVGIIISIIFGYLSYTLIENKISKPIEILKPIMHYTLIATILSTAGAAIYKTQGLSQRETLAGNSLIQGGTSNDHKVHEGTYLINTNNEFDYLLIGDSNANHYVRGILKEGTKVKLSWYGTCLSFPHSINKREGTFLSWKNECANNYKVGLDSKKPIIIAQHWARGSENILECTDSLCKITGNYYFDLKSQLNELINSYNSEIPIYIIGHLPKAKNGDIMNCLKTEALLGLKMACKTTDKINPEHIKINKILENVANEHNNVFYVDIIKIFCKNDICDYSKDNKSIYMTDGGHLSGFGSEIAWKYIIENISKHTMKNI